jgi:hypothetical protein
MKRLIFAVLFLSFMVPVTAQSRAEKKKIKEEKAVEEYASLKDFVNLNKINFEGEWATTNTGRRINLVGNSNFLKIDQTDGDIYLPFFGTAHSSSVGFSGDGGIVFKGELDNYSIKFNDKKKQAIITFRTKNKSESFDFILTLYGNKSANLSVSSNSRSNMSYSGTYK